MRPLPPWTRKASNWCRKPSTNSWDTGQPWSSPTGFPRCAKPTESWSSTRDVLWNRANTVFSWASTVFTQNCTRCSSALPARRKPDESGYQSGKKAGGFPGPRRDPDAGLGLPGRPEEGETLQGDGGGLEDPSPGRVLPFRGDQPVGGGPRIFPRKLGEGGPPEAAKFAQGQRGED